MSRATPSASRVRSRRESGLTPSGSLRSRLRSQVRRMLRGPCRIGSRDRIVVAVSGGADSVALTWLLHDLAPSEGFQIAGFVHVNHLLRGAESDADAAFCAALAARLGLPIVMTAVDVRERARASHLSLEAAARDARYDVFAKAAHELRATCVATGHTLDDQAETVLMRLFRGAGTRGLSGVRARRDRYIRPLLGSTREDLRRYLENRHESWREDSTNSDVEILRNRIRHELMPSVRDMAPGAVRALARLAALAADDEEALSAAARSAMTFVKKSPGLAEKESRLTDDAARPIRLDARALASLPTAIARRVVRFCAAEIVPDRPIAAKHLEAVIRLAATDKPSGHIDLPGLAVTRSGRVVELEPAAQPGPGKRSTTRGHIEWPLRMLPLPGHLNLPEAGAEIQASIGRAEEATWNIPGTCAVLQIGALRLPLAVRNRKPGDRVRLLGAPGSRKLQDVLVDRKIPRSERDRVALVVDANDRIVWVAGVAIAHECRVTAPNDGVLILDLREQRIAQ